MDIKEALMNMDVLDDDQWTADGSPKIDPVSDLVGRKVTRKEIIEAAPHFSRENTFMEADDAEEEGVREEEKVVDVTSDVADFFNHDYHSHAEVLDAVGKLPKEGLTDMISLFDTQMMQIEQQMRELQNLRGMMKFAKAATVNRAKTETPDMDNQAAIREFLKAQQKNRMEKVAATQEILKAVDLSKVDPRAMIDRAMSRKVGRGGSRPIHPVRG